MGVPRCSAASRPVRREHDISSKEAANRVKDRETLPRLRQVRCRIELAAHPRRDTELWHASYVQTYLERDVRSLRQVGDLVAFLRLLRAVAARSAQPYMADVGLLCCLTGIRTAPQAREGPLAGAIFETAVAAEVVGTITHRGIAPSAATSALGETEAEGL